MDTNLPMSLIIIFLFVLLSVIIGDSCTAIKITKKFKALGIITKIIFIYFSYRTMYINWTPLVEPLYGDTVSGIQGRYFIPIMPFLCVILANKFLAKCKTSNILISYNTVLVYYTSMVFAFITGLTILLRYWG